MTKGPEPPLDAFRLSSWISRPLKQGPIGFPETSVRNYHYTLRNIAEERRFHLLRGASLKSRKCAISSGGHAQKERKRLSSELNPTTYLTEKTCIQCDGENKVLSQ